jgi:hypothetical protein
MRHRVTIEEIDVATAPPLRDHLAEATVGLLAGDGS